MGGIAIAAGIRSQKKARENLSRLADTMRLNVIEGPAKPIVGRPAPTLAGEFRGRHVRIYSYSTGSGKTRTHWIAIAAKVRNTGGYTLAIAADNVFLKLGKLFGIEDVEIGDPEFDKRYRIKTSDKPFTRAALIPEVRNKVMAAWNAGARGTISVEKDEVKYAEIGSFTRQKAVERIPALAEIVCDFGEITEAHG